MHFPLYTEGASLKHRLRYRVDAGPAHFPLYTEGASLKPFSLCDIEHIDIHFPLYTEGASLKQVNRRICNVQTLAISPSTRRGPH